MARRAPAPPAPRSGRARWLLAAVVLVAVVIAVLTLTRSGPGPVNVVSAAPEPPPMYGYRIVRVFPHDPAAFTQGLIYRDGHLFESTGLHGQSSLRKVRLDTGEVLQKRTVDERYFAEGLVEWKGTLIQLTWQSGVGFRYDLATFQTTGTFTYAGEGWGLTHDGARLIMSDGTATLRFLDPVMQAETGRLRVHDRGAPVYYLNELEYMKGEILANIWQSERIARIDPRTGSVTGWIDLAGLLNRAELTSQVDVMNGIAYDERGDRLFVTGKLWPKLYEIELVRR